MSKQPPLPAVLALAAVRRSAVDPAAPPEVPVAAPDAPPPTLGRFGLDCTSVCVERAASSRDIASDASMLLGCGLAIVERYAEELDEEAVWGAVYLMRQALRVLDAEIGRHA
ncbi:MAG: hypothetical protein J0M00_06980 [Burkholderiales bacterium]|nr:hypothetical protein [Burkholderiales bacterium]